MLLPLQAQGIPQSPGQFIDQYGPALVQFVATLLVFVVAFVIIYLVGRAILVRLTERSLESRGFNPGIVGIAASVVGVIVLVGALAIAATIAGFGAILSAFAILGGAIALAVGFAAQDLIANFVAGIFILKDEPFEVGDWIEWSGNVGVVRDIDLRVTTLDTFDNEMLTVPNSDLANAVVTNPVANEQLRLSYGFGIGYGDDIERAQDVVVEEGSRIEGVLSDPAPSAPVTELGDSAVVLSGRVWVDPRETNTAQVKATFVKAVKERFDAEGIDMPYPHSQLTGEVGVTEHVATETA